MRRKSDLDSPIYRSLHSLLHLTAYAIILLRCLGVLWMNQTLSYCNHRLKLLRNVILGENHSELRYSSQIGDNHMIFQTIHILHCFLFHLVWVFIKALKILFYIFIGVFFIFIHCLSCVLHFEKLL